MQVQEQVWFKEDPFKTCMSINNRYRNLGTEQISKQTKKKQKQKHVAIEGPGAINKLFKRNFTAAVRVHDPATAMARGDEMVGIVSTLEDPNSQGKKTGNDVPRIFCDALRLSTFKRTGDLYYGSAGC